MAKMTIAKRLVEEELKVGDIVTLEVAGGGDWKVVSVNKREYVLISLPREVA